MGALIEVNGHTYDHTSLRLGLLGNSLVREMVAGVNWKHGFTISESYGVSPVPLPSPQGKYKAEMSLDLYMEAWRHLQTSQGNGYLNLPLFNITVTYKSKGAPPMKIEGVQCRLLESGGGSSATQSGMIVVKIPLQVRYIKENDRFPFDTQLD